MGECIIYNGELYHHGVKGMRWGHRKREQINAAKSRYEKARSTYRQTIKDNFRSTGLIVKTADIDKNKKLKTQAESDYHNMIDAKANLKSTRKTSERAADRAEKKVYAKEIYKNGLVGSIGDSSSGNASTKMYNHLSKTKGKEYADSVHKMAARRITTETAVGLGASAALLTLTYIAKKKLSEL